MRWVIFTEGKRNEENVLEEEADVGPLPDIQVDGCLAQRSIKARVTKTPVSMCPELSDIISCHLTGIKKTLNHFKY